MVTAIFQQRHFLKEERAAEQLGWKRVRAAFGSAALICHRRTFVLLQKFCIKRLGGPHTPGSWGLQWPGASLQCQKHTYGNDELLLVLLSQKITTKSLPVPSPQLVLSVSYLQWLFQGFISILHSAIPSGLACGFLTSWLLLETYRLNYYRSSGFGSSTAALHLQGQSKKTFSSTNIRAAWF